jgi:hypothetical protein
VARSLVQKDGMNLQRARYNSLAGENGEIGFSHGRFRDTLHHSYLAGADSFFVFGNLDDVADMNLVMAQIGRNREAVAIINEGTRVDLTEVYPERMVTARVSRDGRRALVRASETMTSNQGNFNFRFPDPDSDWTLRMWAPTYGATYILDRANRSVRCLSGEPARRDSQGQYQCQD